jgi:hypothetical protein
MIRGLAALLLLGSVALMLAAAIHPVLPLTGAGDLALIGGMAHWRLLHLVLLHATGLIIVGVWARWLAAGEAERRGLAVGFLILAIGQALNGVNIAYMAGAGTTFAALHAGGAEVAVIYQATHLFAVMCGRLAGFLVSIAAGVIALATAPNPAEPRWLVGLAGLAAGAGLLGNLFAPPGHPFMLTAVGVMAVWQAVTAVRLLRRSG